MPFPNLEPRTPSPPNEAEKTFCRQTSASSAHDRRETDEVYLHRTAGTVAANHLRVAVLLMVPQAGRGRRFSRRTASKLAAKSNPSPCSSPGHPFRRIAITADYAQNEHAFRYDCAR
jgi:hypothetical protein